jgi:hypothetical protein
MDFVLAVTLGKAFQIQEKAVLIRSIIALNMIIMVHVYSVHNSFQLHPMERLV